jgi:hypothetical protein
MIPDEGMRQNLRSNDHSAGDIEAVKFFLSAGMSPDAADGGYTALLEAARRGHGGVALRTTDSDGAIFRGLFLGLGPLIGFTLS